MKKVTSRRIVALAIDLFILVIIEMFFLYFTISSRLGLNSFCYKILVLSLLYSLFFCKDIIGSRSIGKRVMHLRIIGTNNKPITLKTLVLRNLFVFIGSVEIILCFINSRKRVGDFVMNTKVTDNPELISTSKNSYINCIFCFIIVFLLTFSVFYFSYILLNVILDNVSD